MSTKRTTVAINSAIIEKIKSKQGRFFSLSSMVKSVLEAIAEGKLTCNENGEWVSSISIRVNVDLPTIDPNVANEPTEECIKSVPEKKQELAMPSWANFEKYYRDADNMYRYLKDTDADIISDLKSVFQKPIEETDEKNFDKSACEKFFIAIYGLDWKWGDDYNEDPDIYEDSLYNYFKWNERQKVVDRFNSIKKQAIRLIKDAGIDY